MDKLLRKNFKKLFFCIACFAMFSFNSFSEDNRWSLRFDHSMLSGTANELVYDGGHKLSELIWGIEGVRLLGIGATYQPFSRLKFNTDFYTSYNEGKSEMDDYDWQKAGISDWSDWSNSPTDITGVYKYDLNVEYVTRPLDFMTLSLIWGYKSDTYKWVATGGTYIYSSSSGFRDLQGTLPNVKGISYNQYFDFSYVGIGSALDMGDFSFQGKLLYSEAVVAKDEDTHHLRDLYFEDFFENGKMIQLGLKGEYSFDSSIALTASYDYCKYFLNKGYTQTTDLTTGTVYVGASGGAGIENFSSMVSLGLEYKY